MKPLLILITVLFLNSALIAQPLSGKWHIIEEGDTSTLELSKDNVFSLISESNGLRFEGLNAYSPEESEDDSIFIDHKYVCKLSTFPHHLILKGFYTNTDSISFVIPTYFEFKEDGSLVLFFHEDGILTPDEDNIEEVLKEFYKNLSIKEEDYEEALIFKAQK